jgi:hypothetical protein
MINELISYLHVSLFTWLLDVFQYVSSLILVRIWSTLKYLSKTSYNSERMEYLNSMHPTILLFSIIDMFSVGRCHSTDYVKAVPVINYPVLSETFSIVVI